MVTLAYTALVALTALERLVELTLSRRNAAWARQKGGREVGAAHFPLMVGLHSMLLVGALAETWFLGRPFLPALGWPMFILTVAAQGLRYACIVSLGPYWNTRVIVIPGMQRVSTGPYRFLRHPNYVAVVIEGFALPLVHTNVLTAVAFTLFNGLLLRVRIRCEEQALEIASAESESAIRDG